MRNGDEEEAWLDEEGLGCEDEEDEDDCCELMDSVVVPEVDDIEGDDCTGGIVVADVSGELLSDPVEEELCGESVEELMIENQHAFSKVAHVRRTSKMAVSW